LDGSTLISLTLTEAISRLKEDESPRPARRRDLISSVVRMCELTGVDPRITPASMRYMRSLINAVRPARHGLNPKTWSNVRANFRAAVVHPTPRPQRQHHPEWTNLRRLLPDDRMRNGLCRLIGHCEDHRIPPTAMSDLVLDRFLAALQADANLSDPHHCHRRSCRLWNEAAASVPGWPQVRVKLPNYRRPRESLPINSYPLSLQEELAAYLEFLRRGTDRFAKGPRQPRLAESTVHQREVEIVLALSALVAAGRDPASITSLACLVQPEAYEVVLRQYLKNDESQTPRPFAHGLAVTLLGLARRWVKPGPEALEDLRNLKGCLGPQHTGFADKNDKLMLALDDPNTRAELLLLPNRLAEWATRARPDRARPEYAAIMMELAVALAILRCAPLRVANLAGLRLDRHLVRPGGPRSPWVLMIPATEVKNKRELVYKLEPEATALVDTFIERYRLVLAPPGNAYLFPVGSKCKSSHHLSQQIRRVIEKWVGIYMTPHQFRHFCGQLFKEHCPDSSTALGQFLGHENGQTAEKFYARRDTLSAGRLFDEILEKELRAARFGMRRRP
jgi:integrase